MLYLYFIPIQLSPIILECKFHRQYTTICINQSLGNCALIVFICRLKTDLCKSKPWLAITIRNRSCMSGFFPCRENVCKTSLTLTLPVDCYRWDLNSEINECAFHAVHCQIREKTNHSHIYPALNFRTAAIYWLYCYRVL